MCQSNSEARGAAVCPVALGGNMKHAATSRDLAREHCELGVFLFG